MQKKGVNTMQDINSKRFLGIEKTKGTNNSIETLKELFLKNNKLKYPNLPDYARSTPQFTDKTANGLTKCIISFITLSNGQAERINCTGRIIDKRINSKDVFGRDCTIGSRKYIKTSGQRGTADISATINGRSVKIEVKIGKDSQSEAQKNYQKTIEASGGIYFIAKDFSQFLEWYTKTFNCNGRQF